MRRRSLLATGAALPVLTMVGAPQLIGESEVAAVRALALDLDLGHPFGLHAAETALRQAVAMLQARVSPAVASSLNEAVALLADRVGWGQHEAGRDASATLAFARRVAMRGEDVALQAHVLLDLAVSTPDPSLALTTLDHALGGSVQGAERANLHAVAARRAATQNPRAAREHLTRALDTEPTPVSGEWAQRITNAPGHLDAIIGFACYAVDHPDARRRLSHAVVRLDPNRQRTRARCHTRLAGLALVAGDDQTATVHLRQALSLRRSVLVTSDLRAFAKRARDLDQVQLARLAASA